MKKYSMLACASLLAISGSAFAEQTLTDAQMDGVSAGALVVLGGAAISNAVGGTIANYLGVTGSSTFAWSDPNGLAGPSLVSSGAANTSVAASLTDGVTIGGAVAASSSNSGAQIF